MDCSQPGSSVHGISQARILEWALSSLTHKLWITSHLFTMKGFVFVVFLNSENGEVFCLGDDLDITIFSLAKKGGGW